MLLTICKYFKADSSQFGLPMTSNLQLVKQIAAQLQAGLDLAKSGTLELGEIILRTL